MSAYPIRSFCLCWLLLAACQSQPIRRGLLPFRVAMTPVAIEVVRAAKSPDSAPPGLMLSFDEAELSHSCAAELRTCFAGVSAVASPPVGAPEASSQAWVQEARAAGADLIVDATLTYDPVFTTSLNDRFWLNLPLFALGGPFAWFVADRSYRCQGTLEVQVYDLGAAATAGGDALDESSRVLRVDRQAEEASLNLCERASFGHYALSLLVPAGFLARESAAVPDELRHAITAQLSRAIARALQERSQDLTRVAAVDFYPEGVHVEPDARGGRMLVGEFVLELGSGNASDLEELRFRFDLGAFRRASWSEAWIEARARSGGRKHYKFQLPVGEAETVQLEVEQRDSFRSRRTFTYVVGAEKAER